jgi:hypothetical protein
MGGMMHKMIGISIILATEEKVHSRKDMNKETMKDVGVKGSVKREMPFFSKCTRHKG